MYEEYVMNALAGIISAKQALVDYEEMGIRNLKNTAAYHTQQSMEYLLKYRIYNCVEYNAGKKRVREIFSHDLDMLIKGYCVPLGIPVPEIIVQNARLYTTWESDSRYRLKFSVRIDSLRKAIIEVEKWIAEIKPSYKRKINQVNRRLGLE